MKAIIVAALPFATPALADDKPIGPDSGTAPDNRGNTGWTGGSRDQKEPEDPAVEARAAVAQPWTADGLGLKGMPRQFSPKKTVE